MMDEDSEVGRPRLQQVNALEGATLTINLAQVKEKKHRGRSREEERDSTVFLEQYKSAASHRRKTNGNVGIPALADSQSSRPLLR